MRATRRLNRSRTVDENDFDVNGLKKRKPVTTILDSQLFRQELENITLGHANNHKHMPIKAKPSDNPVTTLDLSSVAFHRFYPISDIGGRNNVGFSTKEKILRCKLAAIFRLIDILEWKQSQDALITVKHSY